MVGQGLFKVNVKLGTAAGMAQLYQIVLGASSIKVCTANIVKQLGMRYGLVDGVFISIFQGLYREVLGTTQGEVKMYQMLSCFLGGQSYPLS